MAEIVGALALSHSPFWNLDLPAAGPGHEFATHVHGLKQHVAQMAPDALVILGPDHFRNFFYDVMPAFCIGAGEVMSFGDYGRKAGPIPGSTALGQTIHQGLSARGFDPALSYRMGIDHGISQPYELFYPDGRVPLVPIMLNCNAAPRPSLQRCLEFGRALGESLRASTFAGRILLVASGGMSHWVQAMSIEAANLSAAQREYIIGGRNIAQEYSAARDAGLAARIEQGVAGRVNEEWDRWVLSQFAAGDATALCAVADEELEATAGNGAHELRAWLALLGAWGAPLHTLVYEPVPSWVTGMGCVVSHLDAPK